MTLLNLVDFAPPRPVPRDGYNRPLVIPKEGGKPKAHTRITTFIDCLEDKSAIDDYHSRQVMLGLVAKPSLLDAVAKLDPEDPKFVTRMMGLAEAAMEASGTGDKAAKGTQLHGLTEMVDARLPLPSDIGDKDLDDMAAYALATTDFEMVHVEKLVVVNQLCTAGTPDRVVSYEGPGPDGEPLAGNFIFDLKTGKVSYAALKFAAQLAVYSRGEFYDHTLFPVDVDDKTAFAKWKKTVVPAEEAEAAYTPLEDVNQDWGVVLHLPAGTGEATLYWVDLNIGWRAAELALAVRSMRTEGKKALTKWASATKPSTSAA